MTDTLELAKYILQYVNRSVSNKSLHKLVYYCQAWHATALGRPVSPETPQAWTHGPVFSSMWSYLNGPRWSVDASNFDRIQAAQLDADSKLVVNAVLDHYKGLSERELIKRSHDERPWDDAFKIGRNTPISYESMRSFYGEILATNGDHPTLPVLRYTYFLQDDMDLIESSLDDDQVVPELVSLLQKVKPRH